MSFMPFRVFPADFSLRGNLSVRALADVVSKKDFIPESEYMQTVLVAVPKFVLVVFF